MTKQASKWFYIGCCALAVLIVLQVLLTTFAPASPGIRSAISSVIEWGRNLAITAGFLCCFYLIARPRARDDDAVGMTIRALCILIAASYFSIEIGKLTHDREMREFFQQSGLSVPFMYSVMAAEIIGSAGLLFRRTRLFAAAGLILLMFGAVGTHVHNRDPLSDSADALRMLALIIPTALMAWFGDRSIVSSKTTLRHHPLEDR
jgi:uncharacterized membrane protein YphA (DoxX/SURF4 family)